MTEEKTIEKQNFNEVELDDQYYNCVFEYCDFSGKTIINTTFEDCTFKLCNFSLTKFANYLSGAKFIGCKITGADFTKLSRFSGSMYFEESQMNYASFVGLKSRKNKFKNCILNEAFFDEADIALSVFDNCNLENTSFHKTNLEKVDFSTSYNFSINPTVCRLKKAIFSKSELRGLVAHLDIVIKDF